MIHTCGLAWSQTFSRLGVGWCEPLGDVGEVMFVVL